jgi:hypothetical protein
MSAPILSWRGLPYSRDAFLTKGTELAFAYVPGTLSRFAIYETRGGRDEHGYPTLVYRLRDSATVSDADLRAGKRPSVVGTFSEPDEAAGEALRIAVAR